jgi:UDP-GlcNAc:undecaprenyl-phosphate GlcNAc-1-phosphate transferase
MFLAVVAFCLSYLLTPAVREIFLRLGVVDHPDQHRKLHNRPIPRVGGVAIAISYVAAFAILLALRLRAGLIVWDTFPLILKLAPAAALVFVIGFLDDLIRLRPWQKLAGQVAAAVVAYFGGIQVLGVGGHHFMVWWLSLPATVVWLVACSNAVNLLDGIDGLAAGVGFVASTTMVIAALFQHNVELALATVPLAACLLAFLRFNFNPATVFLGDCGSLFIGFLLGCFGVVWSEKSATVLGMTAPLMALAIPLLDTAIAIIRRFLRGKPIFGADRGHIHHRLLDQGFTPRRTALLLYGAGTIAALLSLSVSSGRFELPVIVVFCLAVWIGIQRLGYIEFGTAGRLLVTGSFHKLLRSHISLRTFEESLFSAKTPDECWVVLKNSYHEFGFHEIQMQLAGRSYREECLQNRSSYVWRIEIPLSDHDFIRLGREFNAAIPQNTVAPFADSLRKIFDLKIPTFSLSEPLASVETLHQIASIGR